MYKATSIIHGNIVDSENRIQINSPLDGSVVGSIPIISEEQIKESFNSSEIAFDNWKKIDHKTKQKFLLKFAEKIREHSILLVQLIHKEVGKSLQDAQDELDRSVEYIMETIHAFDHMMENPEEYYHEKHIQIPKNLTATYLRCPWGVVLTISPFNFPVNLMLTKIVPALISGNCVVHKSATQGSLCGWYIARMFNDLVIKNGDHDYHMIPGVLNYITGKGSDINNSLSKCTNVQALSFTGSTYVGYLISKQFANIPKQLELGGLNTSIVLKDADIDFAVSEILKGAFSFSGQRCTSIKKVLLDKSISKEFINKIRQQVSNYEKETSPLINKASLENLKNFYHDAIARHATLITKDQDLLNKDDLYVKPIILDNINKDMRCYSNEVFAPLLGIMTFEDVEDSVNIANDTEYGLQCSIFGENLDLISNMSLSLDFGRININKAPSRSPDILPFSAFKKSGIEVQGIKNSLYFFTKFKGILLNKQNTK